GFIEVCRTRSRREVKITRRTFQQALTDRIKKPFTPQEIVHAFVLGQQHYCLQVGKLVTGSHKRRVCDAVIVQNRAFFLSLSPDAHPVIVQVPHGHPELFRRHLNELQRPNWFVLDIAVLRVSPNGDKKRAKKQTCDYSSLHGLPPRFGPGSLETHGNAKRVSSPPTLAEAQRLRRW